ncbi:hypothetical protein [Pleurocapsa sp. PCC 7319]|uniref:hypothetical protein n=1 Tax=Pleurocapsa sp. PCC 7319 TaxID=118161 RepID=UPI00034878F3|nr:hypothetical protein [Pleurocapsa sp. PCC 7319]
MSKIQITELNKIASEFNLLNTQETTEVIGGYRDKYATIYQSNYNDTLQFASGGYYSSSNSNYTSQSNYASVYQ